MILRASIPLVSLTHLTFWNGASWWESIGAVAVVAARFVCAWCADAAAVGGIATKIYEVKYQQPLSYRGGKVEERQELGNVSVKWRGIRTSSGEGGECHEDGGEIGWEMHFEGV